MADIAGIYSSPRAASWSHKFGRDNVLIAMLSMMIFGLWIMLIPTLWAILAGLLIFTFSFFAAHSTSSSWVSVQSLQYRAVGSSLYLFCYYLGSSFLGSSGGLVWEQGGWFGLTIAITLVLIIGVFIAFKLKQIQIQEKLKINWNDFFLVANILLNKLNATSFELFKCFGLPLLFLYSTLEWNAAKKLT